MWAADKFTTSDKLPLKNCLRSTKKCQSERDKRANSEKDHASLDICMTFVVYLRINCLNGCVKTPSAHKQVERETEGECERVLNLVNVSAYQTKYLNDVDN